MRQKGGMKSILMILTLVSVFAASIGTVLAAVPGGAVVSNTADFGEYPAPSPGTISVLSGNITQANVESNMSTYRWVGLIGNVTGNIELGDSGNNIMYTWTAAGKLVYASTGSSITWSSLADATASDMPAYLTGAYSDNYTNTFTGAAENIGSGIFTTLTSDYAGTNGGTTWKTYSLTDGSNLVFAGKVVENNVSYRGTTVDYQMILPEDGTANDQTATTYYLWVELI